MIGEVEPVSFLLDLGFKIAPSYPGCIFLASLSILVAQSLYSILPNQQALHHHPEIYPQNHEQTFHTFWCWNSLAILGEQVLGDDVWVTSRGPTGDVICHTFPASPIAISMVGLLLETPEASENVWRATWPFLKGETGLRFHEEVGPFGVQWGRPRVWYILGWQW